MTDRPAGTAAPVLGEAFQEQPQSVRDQVASSKTIDPTDDGKAAKRRFWGLGKKKEDEKAKKRKESVQTGVTSGSNVEHDSPSESSLKGIGHVPVLTKTSAHPYSPSSPVRRPHSSSPAPPSPASSQIFERHVQEDSLAIREQAPIPGHITTENHIPPVLDASSEAITNEELTPDKVEIVMHSAHQPASVTVTGAGLSDLSSTHLEEPSFAPETEESTSNYGSLDSTDVRRLSFISFADVVHAEHAHDSGSMSTGMVSPVVSHNRSPSPVRSPLSSQGLGGSPNLSGSVSSKGLETSPSRGPKNLASPLPGNSPPSGGELTIETMRQALRKTGSGDLSGARGTPLSATGDNEAAAEKLPKP